MVTEESREFSLWELYHENSKVGITSPAIDNDSTVRSMLKSPAILDMGGICDHIEIRKHKRVSYLTNIVDKRRSRIPSSHVESLSLSEFSSIICGAIHVNADNSDGSFPRPFRSYPSAGAMYPLDVFVWIKNVDDLNRGVYFFDPAKEALTPWYPGKDVEGRLTAAFVQPGISKANAILLLVASVSRSFEKYGERAYRFALIEAGHIAQNVALLAAEENRSVVPIGGYLDIIADDALEIDGISQSLIYAAAIF